MLDTTFPHDKPQMLYWNVQSEIDGEAVIEITYFTSGISWSADYVGICDAAETDHAAGGLRAGHQRIGRRLRQRPGPAGGRHDQSDREDRRIGRNSPWTRWRNWTRPNATNCGSRPRGNWPPRQPAGMGGTACRRRRTQGHHQGRAERVLHLHDRRDRDDSQRLVQADAELRERRRCP